MRLWQEYKERGYGPDDILIQLGLDAAPIDLIKIAELIGVEVILTDFPDSEQDGALEWEENEPKIYVNRAHHNNRKRFTVAHELGHLFNDPDNQVTKRRSLHFGPVEARANRFAVDLLMPDWLVQGEWISCGGNIQALAKAFNTSEKAMSLRLKALSLRV